MAHRGKIITALDEKADRFSGYEATVSDVLAGYEGAFL